MEAEAIINAVRLVTKPWAKQRKSEERQANRKLRRREVLTRSDRFTMKNAAKAEMPAAYLKASNNGTLPANARQIMYAARGAIQDATGGSLDDKYFTQTLLPAYLRENPETTADWDVVFDARGHFQEPHTRLNLPLGTLNVRRYLAGSANGADDAPAAPLFHTHGPEHRFSAILFVEKEGFGPLLDRVQLAERYDIAIMSTKGMSVTAARTLVDRLCGEHDIPLLVLHDFDKAGFTIFGSLGRSNARYQFENDIEVIDLGLRLSDVEEYDLDSESVEIKADAKFCANLRRNGATEAEIEFLAQGRRVELNAMDAGQFVGWIEAKLAEHGVQKVIPDRGTLEYVYRRAVRQEQIQRRMDAINAEAQAVADSTTVPADLAQRVERALESYPHLPWDAVVAQFASAHDAKK